MSLLNHSSDHNNYFIGLMSGTSLDGVDTIICKMTSDQQFSLLYSKTYPIPESIKADLLCLSQKQQLNELDQYARLDVQMGYLFADCCQHLLNTHNISTDQICAIGSHGQTLRHYPKHDYPTTLQIGDPNIIAQQTGISCVADFRRRDMAVGGQGAPLVPPFHQAIFTTEHSRAVVNIGGIANITFLPACTDQKNKVLGYDSGPGNGLMDNWCQQQFNCAYDSSGKLASQGIVDKELLSNLLDDPFFTQKAPKSTGREYFSIHWLNQHLQPLADKDPLDVLATLLELTSTSICNEILTQQYQVNDVLVCGGGVHNTQLMQRLKMLMPTLNVCSTQAYGLHPDWVEASAFAWLAHQNIHHLSGNLPSVTGAKHPVILGGIWQA
ncbi:MAG: anhydro-N-acetylmuramic acid kinase [Gammaproteobacteria bacterium]|nr:anhydro-N-acetylmuramic acid kinase [Gammaproteobacteria bacterium]